MIWLIHKDLDECANVYVGDIKISFQMTSSFLTLYYSKKGWKMVKWMVSN